MRFMVIVKASKLSESGVMPDPKELAEMGKFNEELQKAGVLLDANGLQASSKGARIQFTGDKRSVVDGPFSESKELIAGYWLVQMKSLEECVEWFKRVPHPHRGHDTNIEIRQVFEESDFAQE
jgi:hypothetical protein